MMKKLGFGLLCGSLFAVVGCSGSFFSGAKDSNVDAFSNRPDVTMNYVILRLSSGALLSDVETRKGKLVISELRKRQVLEEQARVERDLKAISSEIRVIFRYRLTFNGLYIAVPTAVQDKLSKISGVTSATTAGEFERPAVSSRLSLLPNLLDLNTVSSTKFIGALELHRQGITGKGTTVGVIDTGIDYTHAMFGGEGTADAYSKIKPNGIENGVFPTKKVIGGYDFAGTDFNATDVRNIAPLPDANPLDESEHGTHVAGTVAGRGDGVNTYDGVAPDAKLFALKVFGKNGSTSDAVVMAALEFAANPSQNLDPNDHLDVVNLSLGGGFGSVFADYSEASDNLAKGGVVALMSAGNSGNVRYIVGNPSAASLQTLSVAASIDNQPQNWTFQNARFVLGDQNFDTEAVDASFGKPSKECGDCGGKLVFIGNAAAELSDAAKAAVKGNVALIDRGVVTFIEKAERALAAGAVGVVVANNRAGDPSSMGGEGKLTIPVVMISQAAGNRIKEAMKAGEVQIQFKTSTVTEKPQLIDTMTDFSSRGPRSYDGIIKPDISAPGANIISAEAKSGNKGVAFSGTSMAAPHMSGVMALLRQALPNATLDELRSRVMNVSKILKVQEGTLIDIPLQGAGRVDVLKAVNADVLVSPQAVSLGIQSEQRRLLSKEVVIENRSKFDKSMRVEAELPAGLSLIAQDAVFIRSGRKAKVTLEFRVDPEGKIEDGIELGGFVRFVDEDDEHALNPSLPVLLTLRNESKILVERDIFSGKTTLGNQRDGQSGQVLIFERLDVSAKRDTAVSVGRQLPCAVENTGYRLIEREVEVDDNKKEVHSFLQIAVGVKMPVSTWSSCTVSALIDSNHDDKAEQELVAATGETGLGEFIKGQTTGRMSVLVDALKMKSIVQANPVADDFKDAVLDAAELKTFNYSNLVVLEVDTNSLAKDSKGNLRVKIGSTGSDRDDFLGRSKEGQWYALPLASLKVVKDEVVTLKAGEEIPLAGIEGRKVIYLPQNRVGAGGVLFGGDYAKQVYVGK